ncbi:MAG: ATP-binding cassette domain-containing protein [Gammaproteobacteria bacterium]
MLRLKDISKHYGEVAALEQLSLDIRQGSTTALIGPSGCGKSTLLRALIGLVPPDTGTIEFNGVKLSPENYTRVRRQVGYVVQDSGLFPHLTARSNIELMARHLGWSDQRCETRILELAELTHFPQGCLDRFPTELSGGQNQRVGLMRALMLEPEVLLLDEPLGALDPMIRFELQEDLRAIFTALKKTVVMVTHDLAEAAFLSDNIVLMRDGGIVQRGTLDDMLNSPANEFVAQFVRAQRNHHDDTPQLA